MTVRRFVALAGALVLLVVLPADASAFTAVFTSPGQHSVMVPPGVTAVTVILHGAEGGPVDFGGEGGTTTATLAVTPGEVLDLRVGGAGNACAPSGPVNCFAPGGFNGGGFAGSLTGNVSGGSGGGATDLRVDSVDGVVDGPGVASLADRVLVAGGGGGAYSPIPDGRTGGAGGGAQGGDGSGPNGTGAHGSTAGPNGIDGSPGVGGDGSGIGTGGGGGGYIGGGSGGVINDGSGDIGGGGGGSGYIGGPGVSNATTTLGGHTGDGDAVITDDTTPPQVACGSSDGQWHGANVTVMCTATDPSGLADSADASFTLATGIPAGASSPSTSTGTHPPVCDTLNNCTATIGPFTGFKIDRAAPQVSVTPVTTPTTNTQPPVSFTATDTGGSGIASVTCKVDSGMAISCTSPFTPPSALGVGDHTVTVKATDVVGNTMTGSTTFHVTEQSAPTVNCPAADANWHSANVSITCTASDESGLANSADASFQLSTNVASGTASANASTSTHAKICDTLNNCTGVIGPFSGFKIDRVLPTVSVTAVATPTANNRPPVSFTRSDTDSGIATTTCTVDSGSPVSCSSPYVPPALTAGPHTITVTATDVAGNSKSASTTFTVLQATTLTAARVAMLSYKMSATLKAGTTTLAGKQIVFKSGSMTLCTATTNASGVASCSPGLAYRFLLIFSGYTATYAGDATHTSATAHGGGLD